MKKKSLLSLLMIIFIILAAGTAGAQTPEESLRKNFPKIEFQKINPTPIKGIYEVILHDNILYYAPETQNIFAGNIFAKDGRNLTQEKRIEIEKRTLEIIKAKQNEIPLEKALKMGKGSHNIIEFSNPDCSFCRKASKYLADQTDITRYVFFLPFSPQTENKIKYILCAADQAKAYEEAMTGKLDDQKFTPCSSKEADELLKTHKELAKRIGIGSTPFFFIDGQVVKGADMPAIEKLLGKK
jgi:thiol:disulfide interchange protein DsbC